jgi:hypothetical protein
MNVSEWIFLPGLPQLPAAMALHTIVSSGMISREQRGKMLQLVESNPTLISRRFSNNVTLQSIDDIWDVQAIELNSMCEESGKGAIKSPDAWYTVSMRCII